MPFNLETLPKSIQDKINMARQAGYTDEQIETYLAPHISGFQQEAEDVKAGYLTPADISAEARELLRVGGEYKPAPTKEEQQVEAQADLKSEAYSVATELKGMDYGKITGAKGIGAWDMPLTKGYKPLVSGAPAQYTLAKYNQLKGLLSLENIKYLKGTGQISDAEQRILAEAASALNTDLSNKDFETELNKVMEILKPGEEMEAGEEARYWKGFLENIGVDVSNIAGGVASIPQILKGGYEQAKAIPEVAEQVRAGNIQPQEVREAVTGGLGAVGKGIADPYMRLLQDPLKKGYEEPVSTSLELLPFIKLLSKAGKAGKLGKLGEVLYKTEQAVPDEVAQAIPDEVSTIAPGKPLDITGKAVRVTEKMGEYTPRAWLGRKHGEMAAQSTVKVDTGKMMGAADDLIKRDPDVAKYAKANSTALEGVFKNIDNVDDLVKQLKVWGDAAYTKGGDVRTIAKAKLYNKYYGAALDALKTTAPEVYKYRALLRYTHQMPKIAGKLLWKLTLGRIGLGF